MLKTYIPRVLLETAMGETATGVESPTDANATGDESSQSASQADSHEQGTEATSENETADSSTPLGKMQKVVAEIVKKAGSQSADSVEEKGVVKEEDNTEEETSEEKVEGETEPTTEKDEKGPVPYKRFEEVNSSKAKLESQVKEWEPLVAAQRRTNAVLAQAGVTMEEYQDAVEFLTLVRRNPKAALDKIKPLYEALGQFDENRLPKETQDKLNRLDVRVKEGEMSEEAAAELREYYMSQSKQTVKAKNDQVRTAAEQQDYEKRVLQSYTDAAIAWGQSKTTSDPDYKPKAKADAPDGIFEITEAKFTQFLSTRPIKSPQDVTSYLEEAYTSAKKLFASRQKPTIKTPSSNRAVTRSNEKAKTPQEVVARIAAKHGIRL